MVDHREHHQRRMAWMPWLYHRAKPKVRAWAEPWQQAIQDQLCARERVRLGAGCFIAPDAELFAEPHREIVVGDRGSIAAGCFVHGPVRLGDDVSLNPRTVLDGGAAGITIGDGTRIAADCHLYAFDHGTAPDEPVREQPMRSRGITIGADVWIGAGVGITDGVTIGDHAVVGMHAVVTHDVPTWAIVAGSPARVVGDRRER
ncbi:MAG: acyltransferase [Deltaproteobacteria bacterium]|nr:acyltransferase [Deltaproteobacteria bacterium]